MRTRCPLRLLKWRGLGFGTPLSSVVICERVTDLVRHHDGDMQASPEPRFAALEGWQLGWQPLHSGPNARCEVQQETAATKAQPGNE